MSKDIFETWENSTLESKMHRVVIELHITLLQCQSAFHAAEHMKEKLLTTFISTFSLKSKYRYQDRKYCVDAKATLIYFDNILFPLNRKYIPGDSTIILMPIEKLRQMIRHNFSSVRRSKMWH